jgi:hypothetical protein
MFVIVGRLNRHGTKRRGRLQAVRERKTQDAKG